MSISQITPQWYQDNQNHLMWEIKRIKKRLESFIEGKQYTQEFPDHISAENFSHSQTFTSALEQLCYIFKLSEFERDILLLCAGIELDGSFPGLCAQVTGNREYTYPTFSLALSTLEKPNWGILTPDATLRRSHLIEIGAGSSLTHSPLRIDERILHYLTGNQYLDQRLSQISLPLNIQENLVKSHLQIAVEMAQIWCLESQTGQTLPVLQLSGKDNASQRAIAFICCNKINLSTYIISVELLPTDARGLNLIKSLWEREYVLNPTAILLEIDGWDNGDVKQLVAINYLIENIQIPIIILTQERRSQRNRNLITFDVDSPTTEEQRSLWLDNLDALNINLDTPDDSINFLTSHFNLSAPAIRTTLLKANLKNQENGYQQGAKQSQTIDSHLTLGNLWEVCRTQARPRLDELAQPMETKAGWDDLVLPFEQKQVLQQAANQIRQRTKVYQEWGFAGKSKRGLGISALFAGASGTGKTMAAEILAQELKLDLYRIDLSAVVSKYIGETEKNLGKVFDAAETGGVILLFDEADALFGKRSEVKDSHDRHANMEVAYLLQRMEAYPGLSIMTTNLKGSIDQAFLRRIRFIVQFSFPDKSQRAEIWQRVFPKSTPTKDLDESKLARLNVSGGNIRNIAINAAFIAAEAGQSISMEHILQSAKSEYMKMERPLTDIEVRGWV
ncbi:MAG: ATP-binding protein [Mastigocoleus sp.]